MHVGHISLWSAAPRHCCNVGGPFVLMITMMLVALLPTSPGTQTQTDSVRLLHCFDRYFYFELQVRPRRPSANWVRRTVSSARIHCSQYCSAEIRCLLVVLVCTIVKLRHWVSLAPLFGSVFDLCYIICTVLRGRYCVIQHSCCNTNKTIIITNIKDLQSTGPQG